MTLIVILLVLCALVVSVGWLSYPHRGLFFQREERHWFRCMDCRFFYNRYGALCVDPSMIDANWDGVIVDGICPDCFDESQQRFKKISPCPPASTTDKGE